jgi:hypothetical protein
MGEPGAVNLIFVVWSAIISVYYHLENAFIVISKGNLITYFPVNGKRA